MADQYFKIRVNSLNHEKAISFDLYLYINGHYVLYIRAGSKLPKDKLDSFKGKNTDVFFVQEKDRKEYKSYISAQINDSSLDKKVRGTILKESTFSIIEDLFENPDMDQSLEGAKNAVDDIISFMQNENDAMAELIGLSSHDFYTYNHSLDVCIYSLGLGELVGIKDPNMLKELGRGGLLHDIGKRFISLDIICKKGALDDKEWDEMKKHPAYGLKILSDYPEIQDSIKACVFEHHENFMGNGYPQNLKGEEIHPLARVVAIADTYDALTTKRSYNEPLLPVTALQLMKDKLAVRFDPDLLKAFYEVLFKIK
jgi:HD-GYP domain-containing protein (c-di-GMP phosphodiesterase class II)